MSQNDYQKHLILSQHQIAWLLVVIVVILAAVFGIGYYAGKKSVDARGDEQLSAMQSQMINHMASSCNGWQPHEKTSLITPSTKRN